MMLKWGKVFLILVWLLSNQAEWLRCVFHHRMLTFISIRNSSEPAASQPASGATFEMQIFDQNSYSFLRVAVPLLLPPTTCLRQSRRLSVVWGKAFTSDSSSAQTCCSCPRTTVPESFISAKPAITDVSSHLKLKRWFFIIIIIISMLGTSGKWNNKVHKKKKHASFPSSLSSTEAEDFAFSLCSTHLCRLSGETHWSTVQFCCLIYISYIYNCWPSTCSWPLVRGAKPKDGIL